jgi:hypothetical protein
MKEPPGGRAAANADQVTGFTAEAGAGRHARLWAWVLIAVGAVCILLGGILLVYNHTAHDVMAIVTHEGPCSNGTCTVHVSYYAGDRAVSAVMHGVPRGEVYGSPWPRLNITYYSGSETDPTTYDLPDAIWIVSWAVGLACVGSGVWLRRRTGHQRKLTEAAVVTGLTPEHEAPYALHGTVRKDRATEDSPGGHAAAMTDQPSRFTDEETIAARLAPGPAWTIIAAGVCSLLFGLVFFGVKHSGHDVVATVTHVACTDVCTVHVVYDAGARQVAAVMKGVPTADLYGPPSHRLLNINYQTGSETDPTTNDMPDGIWIGFLAAGLALAGFGIWRLRWQKASARRLSVATAGGAPASAAIADAVAPALPDQLGQSGPARIAERDPKWVAIIMSLCLPAVPVLLLAQSARIPPPVTVGCAVLATGLAGWGVVRGWRIALLADAGCLTVRNHLRTYRLNWHDVAQFSDGRMSGGQAGLMWALRILLKDGSAVTSQATARVRAARPSTAEAIVEMARQHGITESLTGHPAQRASRPGGHR